LVAFGNLVYSFLVLTHVSDKRYDNIFTVFRFGASIGPGIWRSTFVAIVLERAAATIFYKKYENKAPLWLAIVLFIFAVRFIKNYFLYIEFLASWHTNSNYVFSR
jgi:NO-binding membrane sensor protein with MHYT domain